jgi:predicted DNA-binding protein
MEEEMTVNEGAKKVIKVSNEIYEELKKAAEETGQTISSVLENRLNNSEGSSNLYSMFEKITNMASEKTASMVGHKIKEHMQALPEKIKEHLVRDKNFNRISRAASIQTGKAGTKKEPEKADPGKVKELETILKQILENVDISKRKLAMVLDQTQKVEEAKLESGKEFPPDEKSMILALGYARAAIAFLKRTGETVYVKEEIEEKTNPEEEEGIH